LAIKTTKIFAKCLLRHFAHVPIMRYNGVGTSVIFLSFKCGAATTVTVRKRMMCLV
jgi:hypothetical protein